MMWFRSFRNTDSGHRDSKEYAQDSKASDVISGIDRALGEYCRIPPPTAANTRPRISSAHFKCIADLLRMKDSRINVNNAGDGWCRRPRIYALLRMLDALELMDLFSVYTDYHLPFNPRTLPAFVKPQQTRDGFLNLQEFVLTEVRHLEDGSGAHMTIPDGTVHFQTLRELGRGGFGTVDLVHSRLSLQLYARKCTPRGGDTEASRRREMYIVDEILFLKHLRHRHLIQILGSYTDQDYIAYLMTPADLNLQDYLRSSGVDRIALRYSFGCLAGAVKYLHSSRIRHRDITTRNILVKGGRVFLSDFGTAYDWAKTRKSTAQETVPVSLDYVAPEVVRRDKRDRASDMWSLGVCFLEIATVLHGRTTKQLRGHIEQRTKRHARPFLWSNPHTAVEWTETLRDPTSTADNEPLSWVQSLLQESPQNRSTATTLMRDIRDSSCFKQFCCLDCAEDFTSMTLQEDECITGDVQSGLSDPETIPMDIQALLEPESHRLANNKSAAVQEWLTQTADFIPRYPETFPVALGFHEDPTEGTFRVPGFFPDDLEVSIPQQTAVEPSHQGHNTPIRSDPTTLRSTSTTKDVLLSEGPTGSVTIEALAGQNNGANRGNLNRPEADDADSHAQEEGLSDATPEWVIDDSSRSSASIILSLEKASRDSASEQCQVAIDRSEAASENASVNTKALYNLDDGEDEEEIDAEDPLAEGSAVFDAHLLSRDHIDTERGGADPGNFLATSIHIPNSEDRDTVEDVEAVDLLDAVEELETLEDNVVGIETSAEEGVVEDSDVAEETGIIGHTDATGNASNLMPVGCSYPREASHQLQSDSGTNSDRTTNTLRNPLAASTDEKIDGDAGTDEGETLVEEVQDLYVSHVTSQPSTVPHPFPSAPPQARAAPPQKLTAENLRKSKKAEQQVRFAGLLEARETAKKGGICPVPKEITLIDPKDWIDDAWDKSSMATSMMSEGTFTTLRGLGTRIWDRDNGLLEMFCSNGAADAVRYLLEKNCNPGTKEKPRWGPIFRAIRGATYRHTKCLRALVEHGVDVNVRHPSKGTTPLSSALGQPVFKGYSKMVRLLVEAGASPNTPDTSGVFPVQKIFDGSGNGPLEESKQQALACVLKSDTLKIRNINVAAPGTWNTPLHLAVRRKDAIATGMLLFKGANVNARNASGIPPLLVAANQWHGPLSREQEVLLRMLLKGPKIELDARGGDQNQTALQLAIKAGASKAVDILIEGGADPTVAKGKGSRV